MSYIGKNIRKIRHVKKLTQTAFAELFDIKRASIGAYEEGRAEPKVDTITSIANYFSISLDKFINKELTVNDLYGFDIFKEGFPTTDKNNLKVSTASKMVQIPYLKKENRKKAMENNFSHQFLNELPKLTLPGLEGTDLMALEIASTDLSANSLNKYQEEDIVICEPYLEKEHPTLKDITQDLVFIKNNEVTLVLIEENKPLDPANAEHHIYLITGSLRLNKIINNPWINKIKNLEKRLQQIEAKITER